MNHRVSATYNNERVKKPRRLDSLRYGFLIPPLSINMQQPIWNYEQEPASEPMDETGVNLRAYFDRMDDEKMRQYDPSWADEQLVEWDGNFRDDGNLMMFCCERDVELDEYRRVLEECVEYRDRVREKLLG